jgi:hypothetical protein
MWKDFDDYRTHRSFDYEYCKQIIIDDNYIEKLLNAKPVKKAQYTKSM